MTLRLRKEPVIDNLRQYPSDIVSKLRELLLAGAEAYADPHRKEFYDVANGSRMFFIHIAPSGKVLLLATWQKPAPRVAEPQEALAAQPYC